MKTMNRPSLLEKTKPGNTFAYMEKKEKCFDINIIKNLKFFVKINCGYFFSKSH
jgi:hypothetical protein